MWNQQLQTDRTIPNNKPDIIISDNEKVTYMLIDIVILGDRNVTNPLTPNDPYRGSTAPLTSKRFILYIYSTNIGTEYFKHGIYSPFFFSSESGLFHNCNVFGSCIIHILYTGCAKIKKNNSSAKRLTKKPRRF